MKNVKSIFLSVLVLLGILVLLFGVFRPAGPSRKNIVLITLDGLRADHLSCYGYERRTTPNIDALAMKGLRFKQIITSGCSTKTALTSLFTSLDYRFHKVFKHESILDGKFLTLAEALRDQGYETFGIVATPMVRKIFNYQQGFDVYEDYQEKEKGRKFISANLAVDETLAWLDKRSGKKPFFIYCHLEEPHPPWHNQSPWLVGEEKSKRFFDRGCTYIPDEKERRELSEEKKNNLIAKYDGAIRFADSQVGRIVDKLKRMKLAKNTVIAISTDHGFELMDHGTPTHGYCPYDEVVRIPLVLHLGTDAPRPRVSNRLGRIFDIGPTLLGLVGIEPPPLWEGQSLLNKDREIPKYTFTAGNNIYLVRTLRFKLIYQNIHYTRKNYWKKPGFEFYDLYADPKESRDLSELNLPEFAVMKKKLSLYQRDLRKKEYLPGTSIPKKARLDENTIKKLRSLGYIR